ncbi:MAG: hypothetical protein L0K70_04695, partial [Bifidobacterium crudilactis]|nr:hypothetical protein [Bifidobacterium crudilactis]
MKLDGHSPGYGMRTGRYANESVRGSGIRNEESRLPQGLGGGVSYGHWQVVPDATLKQRGGSAYFRAYQVISSGRLHNLRSASEGDVLSLSATVDGIEGLSADYRVAATKDQGAGDITD